MKRGTGKKGNRGSGKGKTMTAPFRLPFTHYPFPLFPYSPLPLYPFPFTAYFPSGLRY